MKTQCPHCKQNSTSRKTKQITPLYREITFSCDNLECGYVFVGAVSPIRGLSPSMYPDPAINIPFSQHISKNRVITG